MKNTTRLPVSVATINSFETFAARSHIIAQYQLRRCYLMSTVELHFAPETVEACLSTNYETVSVKLSAIRDNSDLRVVMVVGHYN
jgi:hypothetical protein